MARSRRVSVMMCQTGVTDFPDVLREDVDFTEVPLREGLPYDAALYVQFDRRKLPTWIDLLEQGTEEDLARPYNVSNAAVLVIRRRFRGRRSRLFTVTFGYGQSLLDPDAYERDFGLRVALNSIDPDELVSLDVHTLQEAPFHRRVQASRAAPPGGFDLDAYRDMLTSVTGRPADGSASRMTGSDAAAVTRDVEFDQLGQLCDELAARYRKRTYEQRFGWIDHLGQVRAPAKRQELHERLVDLLRARRASNEAEGSLTLAPPEIVDWQTRAGFWITGAGVRRSSHALHDEPDLDWYLARLPNDDAISIDKLKRDKLEAHSSIDEDAVARWPLYRSMTVQLPARDRCHLLINGTWFEISYTLIAEIDEFVGGLRHTEAELPAANRNEHERDYNVRAAAREGMYLLDRKLLAASETQGRIESCDLLHRHGAFVHVKRYRSGSAELSHLFSQALVSATTFADEPTFRTGLRDTLRDLHASDDEAERLAPAERPNPSDYEIAYAVIVPRRIEHATGLPFFAKLALMRTARLLARNGYRVTLTLLPTHAAETAT